MNFSAVVLYGRTCSRVFCATEGISDNAVANYSQTKALDFEQHNPLRPSTILPLFHLYPSHRHVSMASRKWSTSPCVTSSRLGAVTQMALWHCVTFCATLGGVGRKMVTVRWWRSCGWVVILHVFSWFLVVLLLLLLLLRYLSWWNETTMDEEGRFRRKVWAFHKKHKQKLAVIDFCYQFSAYICLQILLFIVMVKSHGDGLVVRGIPQIP